MEKKILISMVEHVTKLGKTTSYDLTQEDFNSKLFDYNELLKKTPKKGMFIPCDLDDNILNFYYKNGNKHFDGISADELKEAEESILFKGFKLEKQGAILNSTNKYYSLSYGLTFHNKYVTYNGHLIRTLEDLSQYKLELK